jgi:membrane-associated protein
LVPGLAGTARMPHRTFLAWDLAGGVLWATTFVVLGFAAGPAAPEGPGHR